MPSPRARVLGLPVDVVRLSQAVAMLIGLVERRRQAATPPALVVTLNPEMVMRARREPDLAAIIAAADLVVADGIGVVRALRRRGHPDAERVSGIDLLWAYLPWAAHLGHRLALCGAAPGVAAAAAEHFRRHLPTLAVVAADPGDPGPEVADRLAATCPDVVLAAYGAGPQERFLATWLGHIGAAAGVGVGGALDVFAGRVRRAPATLRHLGLEWLWRLAREPWRWRRQLVLPHFWWLERAEARRRPRAPSQSP